MKTKRPLVYNGEIANFAFRRKGPMEDSRVAYYFFCTLYKLKVVR